MACDCGKARWNIEREPVMAVGRVLCWYQGYEPPSRIRMVCLDCKRAHGFSEIRVRRLILRPRWERLECDMCGSHAWTVEAEEAEKPGGYRVMWDEGSPYMMWSRCAVCKQDTHHWLETQFIPRAGKAAEIVKVVRPGEVPHVGRRIEAPCF